jgi:hypothetical protein
MLQRTMMRPRDLIVFFNTAIEQAVDRAEISVNMLRDAEGIYSRGRLRSLVDEWRADYPNLMVCADLLKRRATTFRAGDILDGEIEEQALAAAAAGFKIRDDIADGCDRVVARQMTARQFRHEMIEVLYRVGIIGLKLEGYERVNWSTEGRRSVSSAEITDDVRVFTHPMFYRVLGTEHRSSTADKSSDESHS